MSCSGNTDPDWLEACLTGLSAARVAVFGDFCLDAYWVIDPDESELSVETHLPVRRVREQRYAPGGAGNVVANLAALGVRAVACVGLVGRDLFGREMLRLLAGLGADTDGMLACQGDWQTMVYAKPCVEQVEGSRVDFGGFNVLSSESTSALAAALDRAAERSDAVILNQQVPAGVSPAEMVARINEVVARRTDTLFLVDSRHRPGLYRGAMLKINAHEGARLLGRARSLHEAVGEDEAAEIARRLFARSGRPVFLTRGDCGLVVADESGAHVVPGIQVVEQTDPVGAGDTVAAALAAAMASGSGALTAARLANITASVTVRKLQTTGTATPEEIRAIGPQPDYVYLPELADHAERAAYVADSEIEIVRELPPRRAAIRHALFDHDGTLSTLRQGWQEIMESVMVRCILGPAWQAAEPRARERVVREVRDYIDKTTGAQTLVQMRGLAEMVRRFGYVGDRDVADMHGYKAVYDRELKAMFRRRLAKLRQGELAPEDLQIKGAAAMLGALRERGVTLYLASGTDEADVIAEAEALGYACLFDGRIFGAVGDIRIEAKRVVLERIIREHALAGPEFVTFGDGPVEMRETRKRDGIAVGVASDEVRRFGLDAHKRSRLVRAGADLIVGDFSQQGMLVDVLLAGAAPPAARNT